MKVAILRVIVVATLAFGVASEISAKDWRGLTPLRSTREDVEKLLGEPPAPPKDGSRSYTINKGRSIYLVDEGEVYIVFAEVLSEGPRECLNTVAEGTVLLIQVTPKTKMSIAEFVTDGKKYRKFDPSAPPNLGYEAYVNEEDGLIVRGFKGIIDQIVYVASALDRPQCPSYYENLERLVHILVCGLVSKFDEYGGIAFSDEKARLENFAIQLQSQDDARGYIMVYAGQKGRFAEASKRGDRAKSYLVNVRKLPIDKVVAIDGGYREMFTVQLFIVPNDFPPPVAAPTLDRNQVQIVYAKKRRSRK
jgi:hypothetical protein